VPAVPSRIVHKATRPASAPNKTGARHTRAPGIRPVIQASTTVEESSSSRRFPVAFRLPPLASRAILFPPRSYASPHGLPTSGWSIPLDHNGVTMFHTGQTRPVSGASYTPGPWCSHDRRTQPGHHCRLPAAGPAPRSHIPSTVVPNDEAYRGSLTFTLSGLPLACNRRMEHRPLGFLLGFTPHRYQQRMPGAGTSIEHSLEVNHHPYSPPLSQPTGPVRLHVAQVLFYRCRSRPH
jgi:hypothetical protein